jgi:hypothetical protein
VEGPPSTTNNNLHTFLPEEVVIGLWNFEHSFKSEKNLISTDFNVISQPSVWLMT